MNRQVVAGMLVGCILASAWVVSDRLGYAASAADTGPVLVAAAPEAPVLAGQAAFERPAGVEYRLADGSVEAYKASLAPLWRWDGDVGTYVDGRTRVRVVTQDGAVAGVEIQENASAISNACLEAQMLYGVSVDGAGVAAACAGMWTQEWAEAQSGADKPGD